MELLTAEQTKLVNSRPKHCQASLRVHLERENLLAAIKDKCHDCCWELIEEEGTCGVPDCPLFFASPHSRTEEPDVASLIKAVRQQCLWCSNDQKGEAADCCVPKCALFQFNPFRGCYKHAVV